MHFSCNFPMTVAGVTIAELPIVSTIVANHDGVSVSGRFPAWVLETVTVQGRRGAELETVEVPDDHWLFARAASHILSVYRSAIDEAWERHCEQAAAQRRPKLSIVS